MSRQVMSNYDTIAWMMAENKKALAAIEMRIEKMFVLLEELRKDHELQSTSISNLFKRFGDGEK